MRTYHFDCQRTPDDSCQSAVVGGEIEADSAADAWYRIKWMLVVAGRWTCRVRCGSRWLKTRVFDVEWDMDRNEGGFTGATEAIEGRA